MGPFSHGYRNTVFDRAVTFTYWLRDQYPTIHLFREVDREMTAEFLGEKAETCALKKLQEGLYAMNWIREDIVPVEWAVIGRNPPRGLYAADEAKALSGSRRVYETAQIYLNSMASRVNPSPCERIRAKKLF